MSLIRIFNLLKRFLRHGRKTQEIQYKTFQNLAETIRLNCYKIPTDVNLIVGVPRSGMIPAYILGLFLNKNVCSLPEFISDVKVWAGGRPRDIVENSKAKILFVDDSVQSGASFEKVKETLKRRFGDISDKNFLYAAIYATDESKRLVDIYFEKVEQPRIFQWNYLNHSIATRCCFDMDGVLCVDPTDEQNDDGDKYINFLRTAKPLYIPKYRINSIVTSRLEKYRPQTEKWLSEHHVMYDKLYMLDVQSAEERRRLGLHSTFKASIYSRLDRTICFIESDPKQAAQIAKLTGKQVICVSTDEYFSGKF